MITYRERFCAGVSCFLCLHFAPVRLTESRRRARMGLVRGLRARLRLSV